MPDRTLVAAATNLLARGFLVVPTDRRAPDGAPVNALFAVARAIHRVVAFRVPARAVAVIETPPRTEGWPPILRAQLATLPELLRTLGLAVVEAPDEAHVVASYAQAAREMAESGEWLVPRVAGQERITKPPVAYWVFASGALFFGENEWGVRFGQSCVFFGAMLGVAALARSWGAGRNEAGLAGLIFGSAGVPFIAGRYLTTDMTLVMLQTWAIVGAWRTLHAAEIESLEKQLVGLIGPHGLGSEASPAPIAFTFTTRGRGGRRPLLDAVNGSSHIKQLPLEPFRSVEDALACRQFLAWLKYVPSRARRQSFDEAMNTFVKEVDGYPSRLFTFKQGLAVFVGLQLIEPFDDLGLMSQYR